MKIAYCSDLHLDFGATNLPNLPLPEADVFVIAGDLIEIVNMYKTPVSSLYHLTENFRAFMNRVCSAYEHVLYVPGNHEFYGSVYPEGFLRLLALKDTYPNLTIMDNTTVQIKGVSFYGGIMWTDFDKGSSLAMLDAGAGMLDYRKIKVAGYSKFTPTHALHSHIRFRKGLESFLSQPADKRVVLSHHAPTEMCVHDKWKGSNLNPAFYANMDDYLFSDLINVWIHGHMHDTVDILCGTCRVVCNPRGYEGHEWKQTNNFQFKVIEV